MSVPQGVLRDDNAAVVGEGGSAVIIRAPDQVPRVTALKRFPIPRNLGVSPEWRLEQGRRWGVAMDRERMILGRADEASPSKRAPLAN
jgi:hypothetical protein